jgi:hypothetical protein
MGRAHHALWYDEVKAGVHRTFDGAAPGPSAKGGMNVRRESSAMKACVFLMHGGRRCAAPERRRLQAARRPPSARPSFPGMVSAGGGTSGQVMARNGGAEDRRHLCGGTPGIAGGMGGNTGGAATGGSRAGIGPGKGRADAVGRHRRQTGAAATAATPASPRRAGGPTRPPTPPKYRTAGAAHEEEKKLKPATGKGQPAGIRPCWRC